MTPEEVDKIAKETWGIITEFHAENQWQFDVGLWIPAEYQPMNQADFKDISARILKLSKGEYNE
jgi:hypothetical protein